MINHTARHLSLPLTAYLLACQSTRSCNGLAQKTKSRTYNYFAFGSNMASSTMINLRDLSPLASTAAVLPGHHLRFNVPGMPGVEPSSAAVEPVDGDGSIDKETVVHGVLYKLTEEDFATICRTEGVPLAYTLHRCRVIPYKGDGKSAGKTSLRRLSSEGRLPEPTPKNDPSTENTWGVSAFTLRASREEWRRRGKDIPPSQSYLNVLIRGAREFALDESYVLELENIVAGRTWIGNGLAEEMLRAAEWRNSQF